MSCKFENKCPISAGKCNGENFEKMCRVADWIIQQSKKDKPDVLYECDGRACDRCGHSGCNHTADIRHAKNFTLYGSAFVEVGE